MAIQNTLPDPNNKVLRSGEASASGVAGPGFASVKLDSNQKIMRDRTNAGRIISRRASYHKWDITISYNPMTRAEMDPVFNFLLEKQGSLKPFFVSLPQYRNQTTTDKTVVGAHTAGSSTVSLAPFTDGDVIPGEMFTITDLTDSSHTKAYVVTRANATTNEITFTPALAKNVATGSTLDFSNPLIRVIQTQDIQSYSLNTENLYSFSLRLEEANS